MGYGRGSDDWNNRQLCGSPPDWDNWLEKENPSSGVHVEQPVQDPSAQTGIDSDGNLILPGFPPQLSAPGTVTSDDNTPYSPFTATAKSYTQESQLLLLYVTNDQYSNAVYLRDLNCEIHWILTDCWGIRFAFHAHIKDLIPPRLGFMYPYPFDMVLHIHPPIKVLDPERWRQRQACQQRQYPEPCKVPAHIQRPR